MCVFEPHKYTRVRDLFQEFCNAFIDADIVIVSEIYSAGQSPIEGFSQDSLIEGIEKTKHCQVIKMSDPNSLAKIIKSLINQKIIKILKKFSKVFFLGKDIEINHSCLYIYNDENFILWFV